MKNILILTIFASLLIALGQLMFKIAINSPEKINMFFVWGILSYCLAAIPLIYSLKNEKLSKTFPIISLSLAWVYLLSYFVLKESLTVINLVGFIFLIIGITIISYKK
nr:hypothetical protein [Nanoarchaeum sp.]